MKLSKFHKPAKTFSCFKKFVALFILLWLLMMGVFCLTSIGMESYRFFLQLRRFLPGALAVTIAMYLWQRNHYSIKG